MGRKRGLTLDQVVDAAGEIADRDGLEALSLASVASALDVRSPSLYSHVEGLGGLRRQLAFHAAAELTADLRESVSGLEATDALVTIAHRYRSFARRRPGLYAALLPSPTPEDDPELAAALGEPVVVVGSVLAEIGIDASAVVPLVRALRSTIHGFVDLEMKGGFGLRDDIDESFTVAIDVFIAAIAARG
jgi:AcrR family transcriptional regulator